MSSDAVLYTAQAPEKRNRLTVGFRIILAIPHVLFLCIVGIGAGLVVIAAWFALVFTGKYPQGMYEFVSRVLQYNARVNAYIYLQVDEYPAFALGPQDGYPATLAIPSAKAEYNRVKVIFRLIVGIPVLILGYAFGIVAQVMAIVVWIVAVFTGKTPAGLHSALHLGLSYTIRYAAYFALLTEDWPAITQEEGLKLGDGSAPSIDPAPAAPAAPVAAEPTETFAAPEAPATPPPPPPAAPEERPPGPFGPSD